MQEWITNDFIRGETMNGKTCTLLATAALCMGLVACEAERAEKLVEDVSTEADVKRLFGQPRTVTVGADGSRTLEYPLQPQGYANYVMVIGPEGKVTSVRQLLNPDNFAKVLPGMDRDTVHKMLGPHARARKFELKKEELVEWRFREGQTARIFEVTFDYAGQVLRTATIDDKRDEDPGR